MRRNEPVTGQEFPFPKGVTLVSVTDVQGRITYCNDAFVSVSGFDRAELMGQPHNIVRHPDMPEEAFRDLWSTVQSGLPWSAMVKNRRKNGDHYWVRANVTPILADQRVVGYLSVRSEPSREDIEAAQNLYQRIATRAGGKPKFGLHHGHVVRHGLAGRLSHWTQLALDQVGGPTIAVPMIVIPTLVVLAADWSVAAKVLAGLALAMGLGWMRQRGSRQAMEQVLSDAQHLAACDLSHLPATGARGLMGRMQQALFQLAMNLRTVVGDSRSEVEQLRGSIMEIAAGNQDLSARTEAQAANLEETAASMEEINGTLKQSLIAAQRGSQLAAETAEVAQISAHAVDQVEEAMNEIRRSSIGMAEMVGVIEGVAFQTNILALNAAVEAARAGEMGRGFAVVATEVRSLASRAGDAAKQIRQLIAESSSRVDAGVEHVADAKRRMDGSLEAVRRVADVLGDISTAFAEQEQGVSQVNEAVSQMDGITQQNAAMVEELAASAAAVSRQADALATTMRLFRLTADDQSLAQVDAVALRKQTAVAKGPSEFNLDKAIEAHVLWRSKLRAAALGRETLDIQTVSRDDCCPLGQWLHGDGHRTWGHLPNFTKLVDSHAGFHRVVGKVAGLVNAGKVAEAVDAMEGGTEFSRATQETVKAIKDLRLAIQTGGAAPARRMAASSQTEKLTPVVSSAASDDWTTF